MKSEYEYSYKVTSIKEFIQYCESNNFIKISETTQKRTLYKNDTYIMARITIEEDNLKHTITEYLDFKENNETNQELKIRKETDILNLNNENKAFAKTLIEFLNLKVDKELIRTRYTYQKGNVKFDLNVGLDNTRYGVTANIGYDTKGENLRGGLGLRVIF